MNFFTDIIEVDGNQFQSSFWFPQQIIYCKLGDFCDWKAHILQEIYNNKKNNMGLQKSNIGGWQSQSLIDDIKFSPFFKKIKNVANEAAKNQFGLNPLLNLKILNAWANVNKKNDFNALHSHPWAHLASCLYISVPKGSGPIRFTSNETTSVINGLRTTDYQINFNSLPGTEVKPYEGLFLMFPGNLKHFVVPGTNEEDRISMAFNFGV